MITNAIEPDGPQIHAITANAGVFNQEEVDCVDELWNEYLTRGSEASGYYFLVYRQNDRIHGFTCYGPRALTDQTFDLYWIAVDLDLRRGGIGRKLLAATEEAIRQLGGHLLIVETSGLPEYAPMRAFYLTTGYDLEATLRDFYRDGDDLVIFTKHL